MKTVLALLCLLPFAVAQAGPEMPVIEKSTITNELGKPLLYMTIDGIKVHEADPVKQPQPPVVTPGLDGAPPSDAVVLFDGSEASLANWTNTKGNPTQWLLVDGVLESVKKAGMIQTRDTFGSCQLHLEWAAPTTVKGDGQKRGNSGVFLMGRYEIQVLDSFDNVTYPDGQAGALYGRSKPLVNASRPPGEWQTYDIMFHRPRFDDQGALTRPATFTVLHNGVLIQDHLLLSGGTDWRGPHGVGDYVAHGDRGPLKLQNHGNPVRFRNIWLRELAD